MKRSALTRALCLLLVLVTLFAVTACGGGSQTPNIPGLTRPPRKETDLPPDFLNMDSQMPIVKEGTDITLRIMVANGPMYQSLDSLRDVYFTEAYEKKTGVKIEWIEVPSESFGDQLSMALTTGNLPDIILKGGLSNALQYKYGEQGYFVDLNEGKLLEKYAPNYWALCQKYPEVLGSSRMPGGQIYSLGMIRNSAGSTTGSQLFFNQKWLNKLNLKVPTTQDEFYEVLKAFKENDPNGNGKKDEIGLYLKPEHLEYVTFGMFGIGNRGAGNRFIDADPATGKVRYFATTDGFRQWVTWARKLYSEGLLNQEYFDASENKLGNYIKNDQCGVFAYTNLCMIDEETQKNFTYLNGAMTGANGGKDYHGVMPMGATGSFIVTAACEYPEVALRWADYFFCDEGALFWYYGDEGVTYDKLPDGTYQFNDKVLADFHNGKDSYDGCATKVSLYGYGNAPAMTKYPFNSADDNRGISLEASKALIPDCAIAWPVFTFDRKEQRVIEDNKADIDKYVKAQRDKWILGQEPLNDETWNTFVTKIERMQVKEVVAVYQAALDRAYANGFKDGYHTLGEFD